MADSVFFIYFIFIVTTEKLVPKSLQVQFKLMRTLRRTSTWSQLYMRHNAGTISIFENQLICSVGIRVDGSGLRLFPTRRNRFHVLPGSAALYSCQGLVKIEGVSPDTFQLIWNTINRAVLPNTWQRVGKISRHLSDTRPPRGGHYNGTG